LINKKKEISIDLVKNELNDSGNSGGGGTIICGCFDSNCFLRRLSIFSSVFLSKEYSDEELLSLDFNIIIIEINIFYTINK